MQYASIPEAGHGKTPPGTIRNVEYAVRAGIKAPDQNTPVLGHNFKEPMPVPKKYSKISLRRQVYGALSSYLDQACVIDTNNSQYMDALFPVQQKMAAEFRAKARGEMVSDEDVNRD